MESRMRSVFGWVRRRLGRLAASPARPRKRTGRVPSACEALEQRQVLTMAGFSPFAALPGVVAPAVAVAPAATTTPAVASSVVAPASIGVATPQAGNAYYYGQSAVATPAAIQTSAVAPAFYGGQPIVASNGSGISQVDMETDYVQALYRTVLDRVGKPDEVRAWVNQMSEGMSVTTVATGFVNSIEHRQDEVDSYYQEFLHRTPDALAPYWVEDLLNGASEESVAEAILNSAEYQSSHQGPGELVEGLFQDVLGRPADAAGFSQWTSTLASGESPQAVVTGFVNSPEAIDQVIENYYENYLGRQPDLATASTWASMLEAPNGSATDLAIALLSSDEFIQDSQKA